MKRFRNSEGQLTISLNELCKLTEKEGREYFKPGHIYLKVSENRKYICCCEEEDGELYKFVSFDNHTMFIPKKNLGTFLPNIASDGMELVFVE